MRVIDRAIVNVDNNDKHNTHNQQVLNITIEREYVEKWMVKKCTIYYDAIARFASAKDEDEEYFLKNIAFATPVRDTDLYRYFNWKVPVYDKASNMWFSKAENIHVEPCSKNDIPEHKLEKVVKSGNLFYKVDKKLLETSGNNSDFKKVFVYKVTETKFYLCVEYETEAVDKNPLMWRTWFY